MSLYNDASLVMIPSAYKDGKLYSIKPTDGSGDFTFSRGSNLAATRVDENGLIEKGRENLLLQSNSFDTTWYAVNGSATLTSGQEGYDGSNDAWELERNAASVGIRQNISLSGVQTFSIYAKAGTLNWMGFENSGSYGYFDLVNGVAGINTFGNVNFESIGNGWWRISVFDNLSNTRFIVYPAPSNGDLSGTSGNIYIQDAQLEQGLVATDYIETTTTTAQAGILEDMPRLDYSGGASCPSLLLEPQRTNGNAHSEYFSGAGFGIVAATATPNAATSPEGVSNATSFIGAASSAEHIIYTTGASTYNGDVTISIFAKANGYDYFVLGAGAQSANKPVLFNIANGTIVGNFTGWSSYGAPIDSDIKDYGNGWYRLSVTFAATTGTNTNMFFGSMPTDSVASNISTQNGTDGSYIYGAQIEAASYPTSYIPCYGAATTRSFDDAGTRTDMQDFLGINTGAWFMHLDEFFFDITGTGIGSIILAENGQQATSIELIQDGQFQYKITLDNSTAVEDLDGEDKLLLTWSDEFFKIFVNGVNVYSSASSQFSHAFSHLILPQTTRAAHIKIKQMAFFPTALTDSECIALTS